MKKFLHKVHLYIGLTIGILFFIIALSGAIYTWEPEIATIIYKQEVRPKNQTFVEISTLKDILSKELPEGDFRGVLFQGKSRTANVLLYVPGTYYYAFMDPYTGKLIHLQDMKQGGLNTLKLLHRNLLLDNVGRTIVHWVTLLSLFMVISGIVLWWPNKKLNRRNYLVIKWKSKPLKLNYDLHNVLGFYASWFGVFIIFTGVFWGFEPLRSIIKNATTDNNMVFARPKSIQNDIPNKHGKAVIVDSLAYSFLNDNPNTSIRISYPHKASDPILITLPDPLHRVHRINNYYFDQYTGALIPGNFENGLYADASTFNTISGLTYDIHLGNLGGFFGRLLVCLTSLVMSSLPITGFVIWFSKR